MSEIPTFAATEKVCTDAAEPQIVTEETTELKVDIPEVSQPKEEVVADFGEEKSLENSPEETEKTPVNSLEVVERATEQEQAGIEDLAEKIEALPNDQKDNEEKISDCTLETQVIPAVLEEKTVEVLDEKVEESSEEKVEESSEEKVEEIVPEVSLEISQEIPVQESAEESKENLISRKTKGKRSSTGENKPPLKKRRDEFTRSTRSKTFADQIITRSKSRKST